MTNAASERRSSPFRSERGFTLIEVLAAVALISIGVAATLKIFGAAGHSVLRSERTDVGVQQAQAELDRLRTLPYGELAMKAAPSSSSDPYDPGSRVADGSLRVRPDLSEPFVMTPADGEAAMVDATPKDFATGLGGATITGHLYRYVTWRDENCPFALCPGNQNTKRVTVAVTLDRDPSSNERRRPMWFTTIVADPNSAPPGTLAPPGGGPSSVPGIGASTSTRPPRSSSST